MPMTANESRCYEDAVELTKTAIASCGSQSAWVLTHPEVVSSFFDTVLEDLRKARGVSEG